MEISIFRRDPPPVWKTFWIFKMFSVKLIFFLNSIFLNLSFYDYYVFALFRPGCL